MEKPTVFTIGYTAFSPEDFVSSLRENRITALIDVRSQPYSQYYNEYNREALANRLSAAHILYANFAREFGARQENPDYYSNGRLDFEKFSISDEFIRGIHRLQDGMEKGYRFSLMCAEKDPVRCHRAILVARAFHELGYPVIHLLADGRETHSDLENRLLRLYYPDQVDENQISFFQDRAELLRKAYRKQNEKIGYSPDGDEEDQ